MRRVCLLAFLLGTLPLSAFADSNFTFQNKGGSLVNTSSGLSLHKSKLLSMSGLNGGGLILPAAAGALKTLAGLSFSTGAEISSVYDAATRITTTIFAGGGFFSINGFGQYGVPKGIIFNGTFAGPVTVETIARTRTSPSELLLIGNVIGTINGVTFKGMTTELQIGGGMINGTTSLISAVPEPSTLALIGTGLLAMSGVIRRKFIHG
ncbi:MAG: hypothetical protein JWO91_1695 [Acidobacteriaceae bacterium]|jgi:hypothetical protein|nr:hypothetical protein [Acidobacteriaceae bacterium]